MDTTSNIIDYRDYKVIKYKADKNTEKNQFYSVIINITDEEEKKRIRKINTED